MSYWKHNIEGVDWSQFKLHQREAIFDHVCKENNVELDQGQYAILWEDPNDLDAPVKVTSPSPKWLAMAMHGGILPPVWVYKELQRDEAQPGFKRHTRGHLLHDTSPIEPLTEEKAMEYLAEMILPEHVLDYKGNRKIIKIVPKKLVPTDRSYRDAWKINQMEAA